MRLDAAELMIRKASWMLDSGLPCGAEANMAKWLAADASSSPRIVPCKPMVGLAMPVNTMLNDIGERLDCKRLHLFPKR